MLSSQELVAYGSEPVSNHCVSVCIILPWTGNRNFHSISLVGKNVGTKHLYPSALKCVNEHTRKRNFTLSREGMQPYGLLSFNKRCNFGKGSKCFLCKSLRVLFHIIWNDIGVSAQTHLNSILGHQLLASFPGKLRKIFCSQSKRPSHTKIGPNWSGFEFWLNSN